MVGPYEGVHAFLFLQDVEDPGEVIENIKRLGSDKAQVFFASVFEDGPFNGFAHVAAGHFDDLMSFKDDELFEAGVHSDYVLEGPVLSASTTQSIPMGPKRQSPRFCAICRVRTTEKPADVLEAIGNAFSRQEPLIGASRVIGAFPILVELGSDDRDALDGAIEDLRAVDGVDRDGTQVATADTERGTDQSGA